MTIQTSASKRFKQTVAFLFQSVLFALLLLFATGDALTQEIPCLDLQGDKVAFVKPPARKSLKTDACGNAKRKVSVPTSNVGEIVSISGHITHQNGVRLSGVTVSLYDKDNGGTRTVVTDETGTYFFGNIPFGSAVELSPSRDGYEFYPPAVIWSGIVEDEVWNFIAAGPPPNPPPPPPGTPTLAWSSYYNHPTNQADYNGMLGRDAAGNVYLGGTSYVESEDGNTDITVSKTDSNGNLLWSRSFDGTGNYKDGLRDLAVDAAGNIYLAGFTYTGTDPATRSYDYVILKYDTNGNRLWLKTYGRAPHFDDFVTSMKIDAAGNIYVTGYSWDANVFADYATLKYDTDGNLLWEKRYSTPQGESPGELELDAAGNVYVTGRYNRTGAGGMRDFLTIKYSPTGQQLWVNTFNGAADDDDDGLEVEIDAAGDVFVLGKSQTANFDIETIIQKINGATGTTTWVKTFTVPDSFDATVPTAMELDGAGNIIIAGVTNLSGKFYEFDMFVAKFDASGTLQWLKTYDGPADEDYDGDVKLLLDNANNVYIGLTSEGFYNADMQIIKYSPTGEQVWTYRFGSPYFDYDMFLDWEADVAQTTMLIDATGNLYIAGESYIPDQGTNLVAFKIEPVSERRAAPFDFDGDKKADIAVFRPSEGVWYVWRSSDGGYSIVRWGMQNDKLVPADYDGDGKNDLAVYRDGTWWILSSSNTSASTTQFGLPDDKPIPSDFDNDGKADLSVFRQGVWHQLTTSNNNYRAFHFGLSTDVPIPSDYDQNRRSDVAVYRGGNWFVSLQAELPMTAFQFGVTSDKPVPADYDGDGQTDYAVYRGGTWYIRNSRTQSYTTVNWGISTDIPVPADYDGDKKTDLAVYRDGIWYILKSSDNNYTVTQFGVATDIPIPAAFSR